MRRRTQMFVDSLLSLLRRESKRYGVESWGLHVHNNILNNKTFLYEALLFEKAVIPSKEMSFTYNPKKKKRQTTHGFLTRQATPTGRRVVARRRAKGRKKLTV